MVGRAMERVIERGVRTGYLPKDFQYRARSTTAICPREVVLLCTGSQGEPRAALARIAEDEHPDVALAHGRPRDLLLAHHPRQREGGRAHQNGLIDAGLRGHHGPRRPGPRLRPSRAATSCSEMYGWMRPRIAVPVHGEALHLAEHASSRAQPACRTCSRCRNGDMVRLAPGEPAIIDQVPVGRLYKDGGLLGRRRRRAVRERRRLAFAGIVIVALVLSARGEVAGRSRGRVDGVPASRRRGRGRCVDIVLDAVDGTLASIPRAAAQGSRAGARGGAPRRARGRRRGLGQEAASCNVLVVNVVDRCRSTRRETGRGAAALAATRLTDVAHGGDDMIGRLNHVAIAVPDLAAAARASIATRWAPRCRAPLPQPEHGVTVVFVDLAQHQDRAAGAAGRGLADRRFLERNPAGGIHHVCYEVDDIRAARDRLQAAGARVLGDGKPKIGAHGKPVLFLHPKDFCGTLVELEQA